MCSTYVNMNSMWSSSMSRALSRMGKSFTRDLLTILFSVKFSSSFTIKIQFHKETPISDLLLSIVHSSCSSRSLVNLLMHKIQREQPMDVA